MKEEAWIFDQTEEYAIANIAIYLLINNGIVRLGHIQIDCQRTPLKYAIIILFPISQGDFAPTS
jgi:hypothetical protein